MYFDIPDFEGMAPGERWAALKAYMEDQAAALSREVEALKEEVKELKENGEKI